MSIGPGWRRSWPLGIALLSLMHAMALAACSNAPTASGALVPGMVIDHYTLGNPIDCIEYRDPTCQDYLQVATDIASDERGVARSAIVGHHFFRESIPGTPAGSSSVVIVVLDLADDSRLAVGVHCGVGPCHLVKR
jgi:hypothetical protein